MRGSLSIPLLMGLVTAIAACGPAASASPSVAAPSAASTSPSASATESATDEPSPTEEATESPTDTAGEATVGVAQSDLGEILVDGEGRTLYAFTPDEGGEPTCYDDCATNWPPLVVTGDITVGEGLDDGDFSTVERTDGAMQVKAGDWPLYSFANDAAPGDTNGQGAADRWFVVSPSGEIIRG
jgi:predicted lipoprotein with Yx(FWY)xxD motif